MTETEHSNLSLTILAAYWSLNRCGLEVEQQWDGLTFEPTCSHHHAADGCTFLLLAALTERDQKVTPVPQQRYICVTCQASSRSRYRLRLPAEQLAQQLASALGKLEC